MASAESSVDSELSRRKLRWLVTGCAGFIGSHLLEALLRKSQEVVGLDNFDTGSRDNLAAVKSAVGEKAWASFKFIEGDICDPETCAGALSGIDFVLHQAARGSVPRSIQDPLGTNRANVTGFLTLLDAAIKVRVKAFVYASSSSVYGDNQDLPKKEENIGRQLSPYAVSKRINEMYAAALSPLHKFSTIGFRYFNVFGTRQSPKGPYAAVIPLWLQAMKEGRACTIFGDGKTSRDFCHVSNVVDANLRAALYLEKRTGECHVFNVGSGNATSLVRLHELIGQNAAARLGRPPAPPVFAPFREGDIAHSLADISKVESLLGFRPQVSTEEGLKDLAQNYFG